MLSCDRTRTSKDPLSWAMRAIAVLKPLFSLSFSHLSFPSPGSLQFRFCSRCCLSLTSTANFLINLFTNTCLESLLHWLLILLRIEYKCIDNNRRNETSAFLLISLGFLDDRVIAKNDVQYFICIFISRFFQEDASEKKQIITCPLVLFAFSRGIQYYDYLSPVCHVILIDKCSLPRNAIRISFSRTA